MDTKGIIEELILFGSDVFSIPAFLSTEKDRDFLIIAHEIIAAIMIWQRYILRKQKNGEDITKIKDIFDFNHCEFFMEKYDISYYQRLIENCKEINSILNIRNNVIVLNPNLTENEISDMRQAIEDRLQLQVHVSYNHTIKK